MRAYAIRRILLGIPTLIIVTILVFLAVRLIPGNVIELMVAEMAQESGMGEELTVDYLRAQLGLDEAIHIQYFKFVGNLFRGDFGQSLWTGRDILPDIISRYPISIELGLIAIIISLSISWPVGVYSAIRQDTIIDYAGRTFAIGMLAMPNFWLATMVVVYPSIWFNWTPPIQYIPFVEDPIGNLGMFIIPGFLMGTGMSGGSMRFLRTMFLEVLRQDYIRTAWAKGLRERTIILKHALRNASIPLITSFGPMVLMLFGGSVIMEQIFCIPGLGRFFIDALNTRDYPIIQVMNLISAGSFIVVTICIDLSYAWLDPRITYR
ncbi:MAG: ABC transporter permease [Dehalococcoidales bacterium]|nr:MAG: ABC transporter permease [Dehalococcoidales bacterium]